MDDQKANANPAQWEPGMEITSEAQYTTMTDQLAAALLKENTLEQLAAIAAQHLIYVDALKDRIELMSSAYGSTEEIIRTLREQLRLTKIELGTKLSVTETAKIASHVLKAKNKQRARTAALVSHKQDHTTMAAVLADWDSNHNEYSTRRAFARNRYKSHRVSDSDTVYRWLLKHRPLSSPPASNNIKQDKGFYPSKARQSEDS